MHGDSFRVAARYNQSVALLKSRFGQSPTLLQVYSCYMILFRDMSENLISFGRPLDFYVDMLLPRKYLVKLGNTLSDGEWTFQSSQDVFLEEICVFQSVLSMPSTQSHTDIISSCWDQKVHCLASYLRFKEESLQGLPCPIYCDVISQPVKRLEIVHQHNLCFNGIAQCKVSQCTSRNR